MISNKIFLGLASAAVLCLGIVFAASNASSMAGGRGLSAVCTGSTLFDQFSNEMIMNAQVRSFSSSVVYVDGAGNIAYLYDDFDEYANSQYVIDGFENPETWQVNGNQGMLELSAAHYSGSAAATLQSTIEGERIILGKTGNNIVHDLDRWAEKGYITMWLKVIDPDRIDSISLTLEDGQGNRRNYAPIENVHSSSPNTFKNDQEYPDLVYPEGDPTRDLWADFVIAEGWNYILWRADMYHDEGAINMSSISGVYLTLATNTSVKGGEVTFDDLRIQDGLQKMSNPTNGMWYPPHGRPQYGVYDIDRSKDGSGSELRLLNVRNSQYPSNGDHARMISSAPVPADFVTRVKFSLTQLGEEDKTLRLPSPFPAWTPSELRDIPITDGLRNNTYFRITYDFEPSWDPGHEWFGAYLSLQYDRFGLASVWPIERNVLQDQEPKAGARTAATEFTPHSDVEYEMHLLVKGQFVSATIYEVSGTDCLERKAGMSYTFEHPRHGADKRYPIAIESTGSMRTIIHEVEIASLDKRDSHQITRLR